MWDWGKGNVPGCTRHLLRSRYVIKHKLLALHFPFLKLMKGCACSGRDNVLEEHRRCLLPGELFSSDTSSSPHHFPPAVFMHFISMLWCDLWWCFGCHLTVSLGEEKTGAITMASQTHPGVQPREIPVGIEVLLFRPTPNIFISAHI